MHEEHSPSSGIEGVGDAIDDALRNLPHTGLEASGGALERARGLLPEPDGSHPLATVRSRLETADGHRRNSQHHLLAGQAELWQYTGSITDMAGGSSMYDDLPEDNGPNTSFKHAPHSPHEPAEELNPESPGEDGEIESDLGWSTGRNEWLHHRSRQLTDNFEEVTTRLSFAALSVIPEGRGVPRSLHEFRIIPIVPNIPVRNKSMVSMGSECKLPQGIRSTYSVNTRPYIDTQCAIGLVRGDWLVAVASGGISPEGALKIVQIQDVSGFWGKNTSRDPRGSFKTGLRDGFLWRDTLVNAWIEVTRQTGVAEKVIIQGGKNSKWPEVNALPEHPGYDGVAQRMGFARRPEDGDWEITISA